MSKSDQNKNFETGKLEIISNTLGLFCSTGKSKPVIVKLREFSESKIKLVDEDLYQYRVYVSAEGKQYATDVRYPIGQRNISSIYDRMLGRNGLQSARIKFFNWVSGYGIISVPYVKGGATFRIDTLKPYLYSGHFDHNQKLNDLMVSVETKPLTSGKLTVTRLVVACSIEGLSLTG